MKCISWFCYNYLMNWLLVSSIKCIVVVVFFFSNMEDTLHRCLSQGQKFLRIKLWANILNELKACCSGWVFIRGRLILHIVFSSQDSESIQINFICIALLTIDIILISAVCNRISALKMSAVLLQNWIVFCFFLNARTCTACKCRDGKMRGCEFCRYLWSTNKAWSLGGRGV